MKTYSKSTSWFQIVYYQKSNVVIESSWFTFKCIHVSPLHSTTLLNVMTYSIIHYLCFESWI
jgi:hypothetical protein